MDTTLQIPQTSLSYTNMFDGKVMPTLEQHTEMMRQAVLCTQERDKAAADLLSANAPASSEFVVNLHLIVFPMLMYDLFGDLWLNQLADDPMYAILLSMRERIKSGFAAHAEAAGINLTGSCGISNVLTTRQKYAQSFAAHVESWRRVFVTERTSMETANSGSLLTTGYTIVSSIFALTGLVPAPLLFTGAMLVKTQGVMGAAQVVVNATKLGISLGGISVNMVAKVVNGTANLF
jgi:hypothetical protein